MSGAVTTDVMDELAPSFTSDGSTLLWLVESLCAPLDWLRVLTDSAPAPLSVMTDPVECPVECLRWCACYHGVLLDDPAGDPALPPWERDPTWGPRARAKIRDRPARARGTLKALEAAIRAVLPEGAFLRIARRTDPDVPGDQAYDLTIFTRDDPDTPPAAVILAAAEPHRPFNHRFHHRASDGTTWDELLGTTWDELTGTTWDDLSEGIHP